MWTAATIFALAALLPLCLGTCVPAGSQGCLNGQAYDMRTGNPCGNRVISSSKYGCCGAGTPFLFSSQFCCSGRTMRFSEQCVTIADANATATHPPALSQPRPASRVVSLREPGEGGCTDATDTTGCINGNTFDFATQRLCGNEIIEPGLGQACCITQAFHVHNQSCCWTGQTHHLVDGPEACIAL